MLLEKVKFNSLQTERDTTARYAIAPTKIHNELGWLPQTSFDKGIRLTIDWYLNNKPWWEHILSGEYKNYAYQNQ